MIPTALTAMFGLRHPIVLAPMGGVSGAHLAATVSNAGGLGLVGGGYGDPAWLRAELSRAKEGTQRPWGVGLITWSIDRSVLDLALSYHPDAFMLSFGDPRPYVSAIKAAGCKLICQVQGLEEAQLARDAAADRWPPLYTGRALRDRFTKCRDFRESELTAVVEAERIAYQAAVRDGDFDTALVWAGEVVDLIKVLRVRPH